MKILDHYGLEIATRFVDEVHIPNAELDPVQYYSLNFKNLKEESLAHDSQTVKY